MVLVIACIMVGMSAMLFGCNKENVPTVEPDYTVEKNESTLLVVKANETKMISFFDVLKELAEDKTITLDWSDSEYGAYINSINGTVPDATKNEYWALYTTLVTVEGDETVYSTSEWGSYDYNGTVCGMANVGASSLPMAEGCYYVFTIATW